MIRTLAQLCAPGRSICYGIVQPGRHVENGRPILRVKDLSGDRIDTSDVMRVTEEIEAQYKRSRVREGDVLISLVGSLGQVAIAGPDVDGWNIARAVGLVPVQDYHHARWVRYSLQSQEAQSFIRDHANTTVQATFNLKDLARLPIPYPEEGTRREILSILGALDDKIELNRKTAATLEAMARALYRSWFVDFDPVRAKSEGRPPAHMPPTTAALFPDSFGEDGLPMGWKSQRIGDLLTLNYGKALKKEVREAGPFPVYGSGGSDTTHKEALVEGPTVIVGRKGTVGSIFWEARPCWPIDTVFYVTSHLPMSFARHLLHDQPLNEMNTDAAVPGLNRENVYRLEVTVPNGQVIDAFNGFAGGWQRKIDALSKENQTLATLRDTLLPRLMSGDLRIPTAREQVEAVA